MARHGKIARSADTAIAPASVSPPGRALVAALPAADPPSARRVRHLWYRSPVSPAVVRVLPWYYLEDDFDLVDELGAS